VHRIAGCARGWSAIDEERPLVAFAFRFIFAFVCDLVMYVEAEGCAEVGNVETGTIARC